MLQKHFFEIDESRLGIEVEKKYKAYPFPVKKIITGQVFSGVQVSFDKPHGKKSIMELIVRILAKGPKQYKPFINNMMKKVTWPDLNDSLEILLIDGIIQIVFKNQNPRKGNEWIPSSIQLDPRASTFFIKEELDYDLQTFKLKENALQLLKHTDKSIKAKVLTFIENGVIVRSGATIADHSSFEKFKIIIFMLSYYFMLENRKEALPLRYISNEISISYKLIQKYKVEVASLLEITLEELNLVLLEDISNTLHAPLISVTPVEEFQQTLVELSSVLKSQQNDNKQLNSLTIIQALIEGVPILEGYFKDTSEVRELFKHISAYLILLKEDLVKDNFNKVIKNIKDEISPILAKIKNQVLKQENIKKKFELIVLEEIGSGSFAQVYKVFDPELCGFFACKVLYPKSYFKQVHRNDGEEQILRFKREVRLLKRHLRHTNIISVEKIQNSSSPYWFTMPLADCSLKKWIDENRSAKEELRLDIFDQIATGVKYLHQEGKYHRDLSPNNILIFKEGKEFKVKIADFGLMKDPNSASFLTAQSKRGYGQEDFTDPEQLRDLSQANHLSDIYSLGALLYYLLSGKLPKKRKYVSVKCQDIVLKAMDKKTERYQSVAEMQSVLNLF